MTRKMHLYHNPKCSKSRAAKKILEENAVDHVTVSYLDEPPTLQQLRHIASHVEGGAAAMLRTREAREEGWDTDTGHTDDEILRFMADHPRTLQRPILVRGDHAVIGRPTERVTEFIKMETV